MFYRGMSGFIDFFMTGHDMQIDTHGQHDQFFTCLQLNDCGMFYLYTKIYELPWSNTAYPAQLLGIDVREIGHEMNTLIRNSASHF